MATSDRAQHSPSAIASSHYFTIHTTPEQDSAIQRFIDAARNNPNQTYNLCSNQCTSFVRNALAAGGVPIPGAAESTIYPWDFWTALGAAQKGGPH
jgi:hypothetical protein